MKHITRQGDSLKECGGSAIGGYYLYFGKGTTVKGNAMKRNRHGMTTIVEGSSLTKVNGQPVALHGHRCACGRTPASSSPNCRVVQ